jgi:hypothetical protein
VDVEFLGDLLYGLDAFERHAGLELGVVSSAFAFHLCVFGSVLMPFPHTTIIA